MQPIRPVDRSLAAPGGSRPVPPDSSRKKSVNDLRAYYFAGPGWDEALREAREQIESGASVKSAAAHVGWSEKNLLDALKGESNSVFEQLARPVKKRAPRPLKNRVKGLAKASKKDMKLVKHLYSVEYMTIREISEAIERPYESTYLLAIKAGVKFRRPGRRPSRD